MEKYLIFWLFLLIDFRRLVSTGFSEADVTKFVNIHGIERVFSRFGV